MDIQEMKDLLESMHLATASDINLLKQELNEKIDMINQRVSNIEQQVINQNYKINMLQETNSGPRSFLDALSPTAISGAKVRYINPAYKE